MYRALVGKILGIASGQSEICDDEGLPLFASVSLASVFLFYKIEVKISSIGAFPTGSLWRRGKLGWGGEAQFPKLDAADILNPNGGSGF